MSPSATSIAPSAISEKPALESRPHFDRGSRGCGMQLCSVGGERDAAFRALADAKNAAVETTTTSFTAMKNDTSDPAYQARRKALQDEIDRAQARLDQAECALALARR